MLRMPPPPYIDMKIIDLERLLDMIQDMNDLEDLKSFGLTSEEVEGYLDFFAINVVRPLSTILEGKKHEKHQR